jgi:hypothetical protein
MAHPTGGHARVFGLPADAPDSSVAIRRRTGFVGEDKPLIEVTVDLAKSPTGAWIGSMSILHSTTADVPLDAVVVADSAVRFAARLPGKTSFGGRLSTDARGLSGIVSNAEGGVAFQLTRTGDADVKVPPASSPLPKAFEGAWEGTLESGGQPRRVRVTLAPAPDGTATATLISVDKGNLEIPVATVTVRDRQLELDARAISGTYRGTLAPTVRSSASGRKTASAFRWP